MYYCEVCGRKCFKKIRYGGYTLCSKHMHQLHKHGKFLDNNPRSSHDMNEYQICGKVTTGLIYNQKNDVVGQFLIDTEDLRKVKYHKWRYSHQHIVTGSGTGKIRELSHLILDIPKEQDKTVVDHINGNGMDNRKANLRICTQKENVLNKSGMCTNISGYIGVSFNSSRNKYEPEIRREKIRCHLGRYDTLQEAVYARYLAEGMVFGEYCNEEEHLKKFVFSRTLKESRKEEILSIVRKKLKDKHLI